MEFEENEVIAKPGDMADEFYLILRGQVALILETPPYKEFIFQTLGENEILGLACLIPPYRWTISVKATQAAEAIAIHGACIRGKFEQDPALGYKLMRHLVQVLVAREEAARLHLLDVYGAKSR